MVMEDKQTRCFIIEHPQNPAVSAADQVGYTLFGDTQEDIDYATEKILTAELGSQRIDRLWGSNAYAMMKDLIVSGTVRAVYMRRLESFFQRAKDIANESFGILVDSALKGIISPNKLMHQGRTVFSAADQLDQITDISFVDHNGLAAIPGENGLEVSTTDLRGFTNNPVVHAVRDQLVAEDYAVDSVATQYRVKYADNPKDPGTLTPQIDTRTTYYTLGVKKNGVFTPNATVLPEGYFPARDEHVADWTLEDLTQQKP
jgi:hypothetical protein